jgi:hypothetical protein
MKGAKEQEERATSALLAVMQVVPAFGRTLLGYLDAPLGRISCFTEPHFATDEGPAVVPDGAVVVEWGRTRWVCLVEVKTGPTPLEAPQLESYLRIASREGFQALLTISNQISPSPAEHPIPVDRRLLRKVALRHLSWFRVFTEATVEQEHRGVKDPEQAKVLADLIAFMDDERSGAGGYEGMGASWVSVRDAAHEGLLNSGTPGVREVAGNWDQFLQYLCLRLRQDLGRPVTPLYPKGAESSDRIRGYVKTLGETGRLEGGIKIPDAVAPITVEADLGKLRVTTRVRVPAPKEGRARTRVNWLLRQLPDSPSDLRVEARYPYAHHAPTAPVMQARENPAALLLRDEPKKAPSHFDLSLARPMGMKRGKNPGSFVAETAQQVLEFYAAAVQHLRVKRTVRPPQLPRDALEPEGDAGAERRPNTAGGDDVPASRPSEESG